MIQPLVMHETYFAFEARLAVKTYLIGFIINEFSLSSKVIYIKSILLGDLTKD